MNKNFPIITDSDIYVSFNCIYYISMYIPDFKNNNTKKIRVFTNCYSGKSNYLY
jgi:hypothetical protein